MMTDVFLCNENFCNVHIFLFSLPGKQLRKVERSDDRKGTQTTHGNDVASILARRIAMEISDSESSDSCDSDSDWSD